MRREGVVWSTSSVCCEEVRTRLSSTTLEDVSSFTMSSTSSKPIVIGGKLKLKGSSVAGKKRKVEDGESAGKTSSSSSSATTTATTSSSSSSPSASAAAAAALSKADSFLTDAQRRHKQKKLELEAKEAKHLVQTTYRDRIEDFNYRLATTTEHNDIPRISAAGNG